MMARAIDWDAIRAEYEAGATQAALSRAHGVSRTSIQRHIETGGWSQDIEPSIQRLVAAKSAGISAGFTPKKKAAALDAEAEKRVAVVARHRKEWDGHTALIDAAIANQNFELAKLAKITAETLNIRQAGERRAWGLDAELRRLEIEAKRLEIEQLKLSAAGGSDKTELLAEIVKNLPN